MALDPSRLVGVPHDCQDWYWYFVCYLCCYLLSCCKPAAGLAAAAATAAPTRAVLLPALILLTINLEHPVSSMVQLCCRRNCDLLLVVWAS